MRTTTGKHLLAGLLVLGLAACETPTVEADPAAAATCEQFPIAEAETLISNADTGARKIDGPILAAAAIRDPDQTPQGSDVWVVAINVDGVVVLLAHNVPAGDSFDGPGLWVGLDEFSSQTTGFPQNSDLADPWPLTEQGAARDCVNTP